MFIRTPLDLGAAIRDRRRRRGWSQRELAEKVGASRQWVNEVEKGKARTEVGLVLRALDTLGVTLWLDRDDRTHDEDGGPDTEVIDIGVIDIGVIDIGVIDIGVIDIDEIVDGARGKG